MPGAHASGYGRGKMYSNFEELARICRQQALLSLSSETRAVLIGLAERYETEAKKRPLATNACVNGATSRT